MVDIHSATAEIRQEKKKRTNDRMKIYMACPINQGGHKLRASQMQNDMPMRQQYHMVMTTSL